MLKKEANRDREIVVACRLNSVEYNVFKSLLECEDVLASEGIRRALKAWKKELLEQKRSKLPDLN